MAATSVHPDVQFWKERLQEWYPELNQRTYFLPPVHMNRTQYTDVQLSSGVRVLVSSSVIGQRGRKVQATLSSGDTRDDQCQQKVLKCLQRLVEEQPQVMFVLSQLEFVNYLNDPFFAEAAATFPRPVDLKSQNKHRGDFDVMIIHRNYGILVAEIKAVGDRMFELSEKEQIQKLDARITRTINQLQKECRVLRYLLSDLTVQPRVLKAMMLPNATRTQLQHTLNANPSLRKSLCECLDIPNSKDPIPFCVTSDDVIDPDCPNDVRIPSEWWQKRMVDSGPDPAMTDELYLDLVSRFGGPATTVKVYCSSEPRLARRHFSNIRTAGEGVQETGNRFIPVDIVLHPKQVNILNNQDLSLVYLTGPPGTGKTLVLQLKAMEWILEGKPVHVISTWYESLAASHVFVYQLEQTTEPEKKNLIQMHHLELDDPEAEAELLETLRKEAERHDGDLFVIMDEAICDWGDVLNDFIAKLLQLAPGLHLWAASQHHRVRPRLLQEVKLTEPLRTPPAVTQEVSKCHKMRNGEYVLQYTEPPSPLPAEGPAMLTLFHTGEGHEVELVYDCLQCGRDIARQLRYLNVGGTDRADSHSPKALQYRDEFLLTYYGKLHDTERDEAGNILAEASGLIRGLREEGIPLRVLALEDAIALKDIAAMTGPDHVTAAESREIQGLERKVVVFAQADGYRSENEDRARLQVMSRCTAQLIWVKPPPPPPDKISH